MIVYIIFRYMCVCMIVYIYKYLCMHFIYIYVYLHMFYLYIYAVISLFILLQELFSMVGLIPGVLKFAHTDCQRSLRQEAHFSRISGVTMWHMAQMTSHRSFKFAWFFQGFPNISDRI